MVALVERRTSPLTMAIDLVADGMVCRGDDLMRAHALHRRVHAFDLGDDDVCGRPSRASHGRRPVRRFGVEGSVIQDDLAALAGP